MTPITQSSGFPLINYLKQKRALRFKELLLHGKYLLIITMQFSNGQKSVSKERNNIFIIHE